MVVRVLVPGDEGVLFELLERHVDTSLFLLSNAERAGLVDRGEALQGTYAAAFDAAGCMTAVASHIWNGNVIVQGTEGLEEAVSLAARSSGRVVQGVIGPWALIERSRAALGLLQQRARHDGKELLFSLELSALRRPQVLSRERLELREPTLEETRGILAEWRADYESETLGASRTPELVEGARERMLSWRDSGNVWLLSRGSQPLSMTGFNANTRGVVQVGGVFTPPALRSRGYGRAAVAASLEHMAKQGARRSVLFTSEENVPAQRAYISLGYALTGDYGLVLF
jgi:uncharacterized protein